MNMIVNGAPYTHNYGRTTQNGFGGINASNGAASGEVLSLLDMTSDEYPLLATRPRRWQADGYSGEVIGAASVNGMMTYIRRDEGKCYFAYGNEEYELPNVSAKRAQIVNVGDYVLLLPFYWYYDLRASQATQMTGTEYRAAQTDSGTISKTATINGEEHNFAEGELFYVTEDEETTGTLNYVEGLYKYSSGGAEKLGDIVGSMYGKVVLSCTFTDSTLELNYSTTAEVNKYPNYFRAGDAVKIDGCMTQENNNKTAIIREVNGNVLKFYEGTFTMPDNQSTYTESAVTVMRDIPELDIVFSHNNRAWGAKGRNIYCTKQGDPLVWSDYDSLADGSWWADSGSEDFGGITGGAAYVYPRFFSSEHIYTIYGDTPADYSISVTTAKGTPSGENESFAVVGSLLIYLSWNGFAAYSGGYPQKIDSELGNRMFKNAIAASDGRKYYVQCREWDGISEGDRHVYVYDTFTGLWHEETTPDKIEGFVYENNLYAMFGGTIMTMGKPYKTPYSGGVIMPEDEFTGKVIFNDYTMDTVSRKQVKEIIIRHEVSNSLTARIFIDGVLDPSFTKTIPQGGKQTTRISGIPKRCDRWRLELEGDAPWRVWSIAYEYYEGSTK